LKLAAIVTHSHPQKNPHYT